MHLIFYMRGVLQHVENTKLFLQTQMFPWERVNLKTGEKEIHLVQGALRPSVLGAWEYVFPEESLLEVLTMLKLKDNEVGSDPTLKNHLKLSFLRQIFGAKKLPKWEPVPTNKFIETTGVSFHIIGLKKDKRANCPQFGYRQELL